MRQGAALVTLLITVTVSLAACTHDRSGDPRKHFAEFSMAPPDGDAVEVCHAYTCQMKTTYYFHPKDIAEIAALVRKTKKADTPFEERRAIAYAIALIERSALSSASLIGPAWNTQALATRRKRTASTRQPTPQAISLSFSRTGY
jgi:hypothetical protein